jgi:hypothetical protein
LLQVTLPLIPDLTERLQAGIDVADIGCGSGHALCAVSVHMKFLPKTREVESRRPSEQRLT